MRDLPTETVLDFYRGLRAGGSDYVGDRLERCGFAIERSVAVPATLEPPWRSRAAWFIDRLARRPEWSLKVAFLARAV